MPYGTGNCTYRKSCISFNFSIFFVIYTTYRKKKFTRVYHKKDSIFCIIYTTYRKKIKITHVYRKKSFNSFYNLQDLPQKKNACIYRKKKLHD